MTINKAQGQTLQFMALYLPEPVFAHGQLYVAVWRVGSDDNLTIYIVDGKAQGKYTGYEGTYTRNVVFQEVFNHKLPTIEFEIDTFRQAQEFEFTLADEEIYDFMTTETDDQLTLNSKNNASRKAKCMNNDEQEINNEEIDHSALNSKDNNSNKRKRIISDKEEMDYSSEEDVDL